MKIFREKTLLQLGNVTGKCIFPRDVEHIKAGQEQPEKVREMYGRFALLPIQTHSINVAVAESWGQIFPDTDALVTFKHNLPIGVVTADCVPIMIYAPDVEGIAIIHAGWRGTLFGVVDKTVDTLMGHGANTSNMIVTFGPSISKEMYEVDEALAEKFREAGFGDYVSYFETEKGKPHIDLQAINRERFLRRGVRLEKIVTNPDCTYSTVDAYGKPLYESHRRSKGAPGRNLTLITLGESLIE